jgi:hypothetical protein
MKLYERKIFNLKYVYPLYCTCQNKILKTFPFDYAQGPNFSFKTWDREEMRHRRISSLSL